jgi:hypothetical protein
MYLLAVDMTDDDDAPIKSIPTDVTLRAWYGVKLVRYCTNSSRRETHAREQCTTRLLKDSRLSNASASHTPAPENLNLIDDLATERIRLRYKGSSVPLNDDLLEWCSTTLKPVDHK